MNGTKKRPLVSVLSMGVLIALLAACGSSASSDGSSDSGPDLTADAAALDALGSVGDSAPPSTSPPAATGKNVWWVACGLVSLSCGPTTAAAEEAAKELGIDLHVADGKLGVDGGQLTAIRTALAAKPDLLVLDAISCPTVQQALVEAAAQNVPVMGVESLDCSATGGPDLMSVQMNYGEGMANELEFLAAWGRQSAKYIIAKTGGHAKVIFNEGTDSTLGPINEAFLAELETCADCEVVGTVEWQNTNLLTPNGWIQNFRSAISRYPDANSTFMPVDTMIALAGGAKAVKESGRDLIVFGGVGSAPVTDLVRNGQLSAATAAHDTGWMGWAAVDNMNRFLNGEETVPQGITKVLVDSEHNLPDTPETPYQSTVDYKAQYTKIWAAANGK